MLQGLKPSGTPGGSRYAEWQFIGDDLINIAYFFFNSVCASKVNCVKL